MATPLQGIGIAGCVLLAASAAGCARSHAATAKAPEAPEVSVVTVHKGSVPVTMELPGRTSPVAVAQVRGRVDGIVLSRNFREGADVSARQRLFQIDPAPYRAALDAANATLARAQANLAAANALVERYKVLLAGNGVARQDYDNAVASQGQAQADVASGRAGVQSAGINLGYTDVISPITGRIGPSAVTAGAYVQASAATLMATVQQLDPIYVDLNQSSLQGLELRRDVASGKVKLDGTSQARVTLLLEDGSRYPLSGTLQFTDVTVDPATGSVTVRALFPNPRGVLLPGMFVRASIDEGVKDGVVLVPQVGVTHDASGKATALVVGPGDKVALRALQATRTSGSDWVVEGGLEDGDKVIVAGVQKAPPGANVKPVEMVRGSPVPVASN
ncbi:MAG TPA: efflux RND transporter periplasmic adaptor subunit [Usitatibacter sp.]|nr:efflux RND transporter periplasmic adaptor subunit [Usitatibacter sp.]